MARLLACFLGLFTVSNASSLVQADNPQYRCELGTVDNDAVAVAHPYVDVGRYSDPNNKTCTFYIDGASVASPTAGRQQTPLDELISRIQQGDIGDVVIRITRARAYTTENVTETRINIEAVLNANYKKLGDCFEALASSGEGEYLNSENQTLSVVCYIISPGEHDEIDSEVRTLHIQVRTFSDGSEDSLFVPQPRLEQ